MAERSELREEFAAFDTFWAAYPRHVAKIAASRAFTKAIQKTTLPVMLAALEEQKGTRQWQQGIIPNASTWLHQERWTDEVSYPVVTGSLPPPVPVVELAKSIARANAERVEHERGELEALTQQYREAGLSDADASFEAGRAWLRKQ